MTNCYSRNPLSCNRGPEFRGRAPPCERCQPPETLVPGDAARRSDGWNRLGCRHRRGVQKAESGFAVAQSIGPDLVLAQSGQTHPEAESREPGLGEGKVAGPPVKRLARDHGLAD